MSAFIIGLLSLLCGWFWSEASVFKRRAKFWEKAFDEYHELNMRHYKERAEQNRRLADAVAEAQRIAQRQRAN